MVEMSEVMEVINPQSKKEDAFWHKLILPKEKRRHLFPTNPRTGVTAGSDRPAEAAAYIRTISAPIKSRRLGSPRWRTTVNLTSASK